MFLCRMTFFPYYFKGEMCLDSFLQSAQYERQESSISSLVLMQTLLLCRVDLAQGPLPGE